MASTASQLSSGGKGSPRQGSQGRQAMPASSITAPKTPGWSISECRMTSTRPVAPCAAIPYQSRSVASAAPSVSVRSLA